MNDFDWRNKPRSTTSPVRKHIVTNPLPITFNGAILPGTRYKAPNAFMHNLKETASGIHTKKP